MNARTVARSRRGRARKVFFSSVIAKLSSPFHENVLLVVESSLVDFSFDLRSFVRSFVRHPSHFFQPLRETIFLFLCFFTSPTQPTKTREKRYDTRVPKGIIIFFARALQGGRIKHQSCHQNPLARRLHLRPLKRRRPMDFHRFPKTAS